jgi:hypothetical protein
VDGFVAWLEATALSRAVVGHGWVWPLCETIHFIGLSLVLGIAGFFDLRLIGFLKRVPLAAVRDLMPLAVVGFVLNLVTGIAFFIGMPHQYVRNVAWWAKVCCLLLAGLNALLFETRLGAQTRSLGAGDDTPLSAKVIGAVSLASWLGALYFGRMLPFLGNAF